MDVSRREALHRLATLAGGALSAPTVGALLSGCRAEPAASDWQPRVLTSDQAELLASVVDLIIPATDTPGAAEVGVPVFIDKLLADWVEPDVRARFLTGLSGVDQQAQEAFGVAFREAAAEQQNALLGRLDQAAVQAREQGADPLPFFATLKEWTLVGYYTSEAGATEELQWLAVPGRFDADLPVSEVGPTWA